MIALNKLKKVTKPARYIGGEYNSIIKQNYEMRFCFAFPDLYEIGMANLGLKIIYDLLNKREDTWCERCFAPYVDMEKILRENNQKLFALESRDSLDKFDIIGFTLQYEMSYTNILNMLNLSEIPVHRKDRKNDFPFIVAGGAGAFNPYPLSQFIDIFMVGDGEEILNVLMDKYKQFKNSNREKSYFYELLKNEEGFYIPHIHTKKDIIKRQIIHNMDNIIYPTNPIVPSTAITQDRISLEIFRGCSRGCRFCQAGFVYRPVREKSIETIVNNAIDTIKNTGNNELSLSSLSTTDYSKFIELASSILEIENDKKVSFSLPSLRIDSMNVDILTKLKSVRKSTLTFAIEAGSQRLRNVINKNITKEDILNTVDLAIDNGWTSFKLYFMLGLPTEDFDDVNEIVNITNDIIKRGKERNKKLSISMSTSVFVPKPHTPFMWCKFDNFDIIDLKQKLLKEKLNRKYIKYSYHDAKLSMLEALVSRGDEKIGDLIYRAYKYGAKFDSHEDIFDFEIWEKAIYYEKIDLNKYIYTNYDLDYEFCFDNIHTGVTKEFLKREYTKAMEGKNTNNCMKTCNNCGIEKCKLRGKHYASVK